MGFTQESVGFYKKKFEILGDDPKILKKIVENYLKSWWLWECYLLFVTAAIYWQTKWVRQNILC